jgi:hypothetical protein
MSNTKNSSYVLEARSDKSVNITDYSIKESFSPEVDEVYIEKEGNFFTMYLTNEKGESLEFNLHNQEFEMIRRAMNRIAKEAEQ